MFKLLHSCTHLTLAAAAAAHANVMFKILQARLQQYVNHELPAVKDGFRKGRGTRDQIANIRWITEKKRLVTISSTVYSILENSNNLNSRCGLLLTQGYFFLLLLLSRFSRV